MKLHLPVAVLCTLCAAAVVQATPLTEDTYITANTDNLIGKESCSYDGDGKKYDLTISSNSGTIYNVKSKATLSFENIDALKINANELNDPKTPLIQIAGASGLTQLLALKINDNNTVEIKENKQIIPASDTSTNYGKGIFFVKDSCVEMNNNSSLSFIGNQVKSSKNHTNSPMSVFTFSSTQCSGNYYSEQPYTWDTFNMNENGNVTFNGNALTSEHGSGSGGAMNFNGQAGWKNWYNGETWGYYYDVTEVNMKGNKNLTFEGNKLDVAKDAKGGAVVFAGSKATISGTTEKLSFKENDSISAEGNSYGGAICVDNSEHTTLHIVDNAAVEFIGNTATVKSGSGKAEGGAIHASLQRTELKISGNDSVLFSGNGVVHESSNSGLKGGAIYTSHLAQITGNKEVTFEKNYEKGKDSLLLRSIYAEGSDLKLSAVEGGHVTFHDTINVVSAKFTGWSLGEIGFFNPRIQADKYHDAGVYGGNLILNEGENQTGKIIFSGKYTQQHLSEIANEEITDAAVIQASRSSYVEGNVTLHQGTLSLQDDVTLTATTLTIKEGAALEAVRTAETPSMVLFSGVQDASLPTTAATLDADLVLEDSSIVVMDGGTFDLNGNALTLKGTVHINVFGDLMDADELVLFSNVSEVSIEDGGEFDFVVNGVNTTAAFADGNVTIDMSEIPALIPEPTTTTLSLLALCGLVARRRRSA